MTLKSIFKILFKNFINKDMTKPDPNDIIIS